MPRRMTDTRSPPPVDARDFDAIEAAVMETERGRWFLAEFAKRNRLGETRLLLDAITRLEQNVGSPPPSGDQDGLRAAFAALAEQLAAAGAELGTSGDLPAAFDGFVQSAGRMEGAGADIHDAAERVSEIAWRLREAGVSPTLCGELETAAADISTACAFTALTARRAGALAKALGEVGRVLESLPPALRPTTRPAPVAPAPAPVAPSPAPRQTARPAGPPVQAAAAPAKAAPAPAPAPAHAGADSPEVRVAPKPAQSSVRMPVPSLAAIEKLDFRERLKLFT
jgi:hypothetical protein